MTRAALMPVFVQVALTFALLFWMGGRRVWLLRTRQVKMSAIALGQGGYPESLAKITRAFHNQLEMPPLFYAVVALALVNGPLPAGFIWAEWAYVIFRLLHAGVHVTSNYVPLRFYMFCGSTVALGTLWAMLAVRVFDASPA